ncbi:hypothetical protein [Coraliomargarita sinensis]|uniref:hypothetical protein n=1 Tax=Coraliomargarita sinensis TaxID=2174842 RepID=UPI0018EE7B53|nr:hypothetical protein [Coraliomargarita sinensis]
MNHRRHRHLGQSDRSQLSTTAERLCQLWLPLDAISLSDFLSTKKQDVFTFGRPPVAIDLLTKVAGLEFDEAYQSSESIMVDGAPTRLLSVQSLRKAKIAAGRHRNLDDLEHLN